MPLKVPGQVRQKVQVSLQGVADKLCDLLNMHRLAACLASRRATSNGAKVAPLTGPLCNSQRNLYQFECNLQLGIECF